MIGEAMSSVNEREREREVCVGLRNDAYAATRTRGTLLLSVLREHDVHTYALFARSLAF